MSQTDLQFAEEMKAKYRGLLAQCGGMKSLSTGGQTYTFDDLQSQYRHWCSEVTRLNGTGRMIRSIDLGGAL